VGGLGKYLIFSANKKCLLLTLDRKCPTIFNIDFYAVICVGQCVFRWLGLCTSWQTMYTMETKVNSLQPPTVYILYEPIAGRFGKSKCM